MSSPNRSMCLILHGRAADTPELHDALPPLREAGHDVELRVTQEPGDAEQFAAEAVAAGIEAVIAAGGDGTLNSVVNGVMRAGPPSATAVGVVPLGTANDFATACRIPTDDPRAALQLIVEARPVPIDVGKVNERFFLNVASGGVGAEITARTPDGVKKALGGVAYALTALAMAANLRPYHARLRFDGRQAEGDVLLVAVGNGRQAGGGYQVAPQALLDDGLLDLMVVHDADLADLGMVFAELFDPADEGNRHVGYVQLARVSIETDEEIPFNLDGEPIRGTSFHFEVLPRSLPFLLPADAPLLAAASR